MCDLFRLMHGKAKCEGGHFSMTKENARLYKREWRRRHPNAERKYRIRCAVNLLKREGFTISKPEGWCD